MQNLPVSLSACRWQMGCWGHDASARQWKQPSQMGSGCGQPGSQSAMSYVNIPLSTPALGEQLSDPSTARGSASWESLELPSSRLLLDSIRLH